MIWVAGTATIAPPSTVALVRDDVATVRVCGRVFVSVGADRLGLWGVFTVVKAVLASAFGAEKSISAPACAVVGVAGRVGKAGASAIVKFIAGVGTFVSPSATASDRDIEATVKACGKGSVDTRTSKLGLWGSFTVETSVRAEILTLLSPVVFATCSIGISAIGLGLRDPSMCGMVGLTCVAGSLNSGPSSVCISLICGSDGVTCPLSARCMATVSDPLDWSDNVSSKLRP
jgi:uncharacterized membrane protein YuzA (DUF378 family)